MRLSSLALHDQAAEHPARVRRYNSSAVTQSISQKQQKQQQQQQQKQQQQLRTHSERSQQGQHQSGQSAEVSEFSHLASVGETGLHSTDVTTQEEVFLHQGQAKNVAEASKSPPQHDEQISNDPRKIQVQIAAKKAEMERLQAQLTTAKRDAARPSAVEEAPEVKVTVDLLFAMFFSSLIVAAPRDCVAPPRARCSTARR